MSSTKEWVLRRIMRGEDPRELGRRGGLKAAALRRQKIVEEEKRRKVRRYWDD